MRSTLWIAFSALAALWGYFALEIADRDLSAPAYVAPDGEALSAPTLNNEGVAMAQAKRYGDAEAFFERASAFAPTQAIYAVNLDRVRNRRSHRAWLRVLVPATAILALGTLAGKCATGCARRRRRQALKRLRLRAEPWLELDRDAKKAELKLKLNEPVGRVLRDHPLTIVWSSSRHGKHMKSKPPVETDGTRLHVLLNEERIERLRKYPGDWKGFLYLGKTQVGEAVARVG